MNIGIYIWKKRLGLGLTQEILAEKSEVTQSFLSKVEKLGIDPSFSRTVKILRALGIEVKLVRKKIP